MCAQLPPVTPPPPPPTEPTVTRKMYITLPYCNRKMDEWANRLTKLVNNTFETVDLRVAFQAPNTIGKKFPFKDKIKDKLSNASVIYKIKCRTCGEAYIGKTERILSLRVKEHNKVFNKPDPKSETACHTHRIEHPDHIIDANDIEIIDRANTGFKLTIKEMMHISQEKPQLNIQHAASYKNKNVEQYKINLNTYVIAYQS